MKSAIESELNALIRLLSDDDPAVQAMVRARLMDMGSMAGPALWKACLESSGLARNRIAAVLARLSPDAGQELALYDWQVLTEGDRVPDLEQGVALIARSNYADLDWTPYSRELDRMADELTIRLSGAADSTGVVQAAAEYLFQDQHFAGPDMKDYDPDDSYMNRVLDRRRGLPISLSVVCLLIGQRLSLPFHGIGLPGHFIVMYQTPEAEVLFDPYHGGMTVSRERCEELLIQRQYTHTEEYFEPYSNRMILARMLGNLRNFYLYLHDRERLATVTRYFHLVTGDRI